MTVPKESDYEESEEESKTPQVNTLNILISNKEQMWWNQTQYASILKQKKL